MDECKPLLCGGGSRTNATGAGEADAAGSNNGLRYSNTSTANGLKYANSSGRVAGAYLPTLVHIKINLSHFVVETH